MVITLTGFMGCGKSSVGRILADRMGCRFADLDELIVERQGCRIADIFRERGEEVFRRIELETLQEVLRSCEETGQDMVLALGGGALGLPEARREVLSGSRCVFLDTKLETIKKRLGGSDSSRPLFAKADELYHSRQEIYRQAPYAVKTDSLTPEEVAKQIESVLKD